MAASHQATTRGVAKDRDIPAPQGLGGVRGGHRITQPGAGAAGTGFGVLVHGPEPYGVGLPSTATPGRSPGSDVPAPVLQTRHPGPVPRI